ncbi:hypothetical protein [Microcystis aeruginosa]|uniref:hypothetical protein n=1 Tax=Microcystis aeruginosa TaxID=1126 RepID=UPI001E2E51D5|nr:hypothetical protein [Microcystis aeruginosa]
MDSSKPEILSSDARRIHVRLRRGVCQAVFFGKNYQPSNNVACDSYKLADRCVVLRNSDRFLIFSGQGLVKR